MERVNHCHRDEGLKEKKIIIIRTILKYSTQLSALKKFCLEECVGKIVYLITNSQALVREFQKIL